DPLVMVNPEITRFGEQMQVTEEGCLSIPELYYEVERPNDVTVKYTDLDGNEVVKDAEGKLAVCIQHEIDHLDVVKSIDYLSPLKRGRVIKNFDKAAKRAAGYPPFFLLPLWEKVARAARRMRGPEPLRQTPHPPFGHPLPQGERGRWR